MKWTYKGGGDESRSKLDKNRKSAELRRHEALSSGRHHKQEKS